MNAADRAVQRPPRRAAAGRRRATARSRTRRARDLRRAAARRATCVVANDAATLPASLRGVHVPSGAPIEVRLAGRRSLARRRRARASAPSCSAPATTARAPRTAPLPPPLARRRRARARPAARDGRCALLGHPRLVELRFDGDAGRDLGRHRAPRPADPVRARRRAARAVGRVDARSPAPPVAFEPPSAGFVLDWQLLDALRARGIGFATLTHAAGISSTGDRRSTRACRSTSRTACRRRRSPRSTRAQARGGRVVAIGTTVVRALEHAAARPAGCAPATASPTQRIGRRRALRVVDAIVSGTHEPGTSHYELLRAFADDATLRARRRARSTRTATGRTSSATRC